ncbi:MAG: hypothetical protein HIU85_18420 [Proteobacteria bacterium]|nr:hypothetical protein [Pseudomonadota bacterium]
MRDVILQLFSTDGFVPHGTCYLWRPGVLALHVISDGLIGASYYSIPFTLSGRGRSRGEDRHGGRSRS